MLKGARNWKIINIMSTSGFYHNFIKSPMITNRLILEVPNVQISYRGDK